MKTNCTICGGSGVIKGTKQLPDVACTCQRNRPLTQLIDEVVAKYASVIYWEQMTVQERARHIRKAILEIIEPLEKELAHAVDMGAQRAIAAETKLSELQRPLLTSTTILALEQKVAELQRDKERIDWLDAEPNNIRSLTDKDGFWWTPYVKTIRIAIDSAMHSEKRGGE